MLLFGDSKGNLRITGAYEGYDLHELKIADLYGNGDYDILGNRIA